MSEPRDVIGDVMFEFQGRIVDYISDYTPGKPYPRGSGNDVLDALGANGYVVVSEPLLRELLAAASGAVRALNEDWYGGTRRRLSDAAAAVVEAVGPTKEGKQ